MLRRKNYREHVGCKDPNCLNKIEDIETWDFNNPEDAGNGYSPCCGHCGCCPCYSWFCWECRAKKIPFKWWHSLTWHLWRHRKWDKYLKRLYSEGDQ